MSKKKNTGLGRGLDALFGEIETPVQTDQDSEETESGENGIRNINLDDIKPNANQPRKTFDEEKIRELADSISENGLIQPVVLRRSGEGYEIVAGERRWRAARLAGMKTIPSIIRELSEKELALFAIIENMQREDLNPIEEAKGVSSMVETYGMTQDQVSKSLGKSRPYVTNMLRLLRLPQQIQDMINEGKITNGHGRALLALPTEKMQIEVAKKIVSQGLSVRQTEELVRNGGTRRTPKPRKVKKSPDVMQVETELKDIFGTKVSLKQSGKKGRIEIEYYGRDDMERLIDMLRSI